MKKYHTHLGTSGYIDMSPNSGYAVRFTYPNCPIGQLRIPANHYPKFYQYFVYYQ